MRPVRPSYFRGVALPASILRLTSSGYGSGPAADQADRWYRAPSPSTTPLRSISSSTQYGRRLVPEARFRWAQMAANAAETLGKVHQRSARHDRRVPLLVAFVDNLPMPDARQRVGVSRLELLRERAGSIARRPDPSS